MEAVVVEAFDINEVANDVYEHNFGHRPSQVSAFRLSYMMFGILRRLDSAIWHKYCANTNACSEFFSIGRFSQGNIPIRPSI